MTVSNNNLEQSSEKENRLKDLVESEDKCVKSCKNAIDWLNNFYDPSSKYFRVAYISGENEEKLDHNSATDIIGRIIRECEYNQLVPDNIRQDQPWKELSKNVKKSLVKLTSARTKLHGVLPLITMGFLPVFTISYLAEFLAIDGNYDNQAYKIAIRRILYAIFRESSKEGLSTDKMEKFHPFLLYRCMRSLNGFKNLIHPDHLNNNQDIKNFLSDLKNNDALKKAAKRRLGKKNFSERDINSTIGTDHDWDAFARNAAGGKKSLLGFLDKLLSNLEDKAFNDATNQMIRKGNPHGPDIDISSLAFSLGILAEISQERYIDIIQQGLRIIFDSCENGLFPASIPFLSDNKGKAIFVPSIEIANIALKILLNCDNIERSLNFEISLTASKMVQERLSESYNKIEIEDGRGEKKHKWMVHR